MLNFDFLYKSLGLASPPHVMIFPEKCFSYYISLTDQISLSDCFFFKTYWAMRVL